VGALLSRELLDHARVWYLQATPSVCPGCSRGCSINIWHRKQDWALNALDPRLNTRIDRVTPLENPAVNGLWTCNKARDLAQIFERPRAVEPMMAGRVVDLAAATDSAAALIAEARNPVALVSTWGSNEELESYLVSLAPRFRSVVKTDWLRVPGEVVEDDLLIKADKNPNRTRALAMFPAEIDVAGMTTNHEGTKAQRTALEDADLLLVWGEGFDLSLAPPGAKVILLDSYAKAQNSSADVFIPISIQTERSGHYTNFAGVVTPFMQCFQAAPTVAHAAELFAALGALLAERSALAGASVQPAELRA
jgi:NADH-quinone oxidoreductase subunit G